MSPCVRWKGLYYNRSHPYPTAVFKPLLKRIEDRTKQMGLYFDGWTPAERRNSTWMTVKDLNPENTVLSRKKCPFIEISWTGYFHLHLSRIIRPNFNKRHGLQWITSAPRKQEFQERLKLNRSFQKSLVAHQAETMSFLLHNFPDAIFRQLLAESSNVFYKDVFFWWPRRRGKIGSV